MSEHEAGFPAYLDSLIVKIADMQPEGRVDVTDIFELHGKHFREHPPTWAHLAGPRMEELGWGRMHRGPMREGFLLGGGGAARAHEVRAARSRNMFERMIGGMTRSDWIAIAALLVAIFKPG